MPPHRRESADVSPAANAGFARAIDLSSNVAERVRIAGVEDLLFVTGMAALLLQSTPLGPFLPAHIWLFIALPILAREALRQITTVEEATFVVFISYAVLVGAFFGYDRIKQFDQIVKFLLIYPGFFCLGRLYGARYAASGPPLGYIFLYAILIFEFIVEQTTPAALYIPLDFAEGALHGTFKERNWLADYFFLFSYILLEMRGSWRKAEISKFLILNLAVTLLSGSKTTLIACALAIALRARISLPLRLLAVVVGLTFYVYFFADQLSDEHIRVRLEDERGLAFSESLGLIGSNPLGYGFGFVEAYFKQLPLQIRGLGEGTNSVFSAPLDLFLISGPIGLMAWLVFFLGVGLKCATILAPVAVLSLLNPLHQSELVYFFVGMLISINLQRIFDADSQANQAGSDRLLVSDCAIG
jgi:hypothetical protein